MSDENVKLQSNLNIPSYIDVTEEEYQDVVNTMLDSGIDTSGYSIDMLRKTKQDIYKELYSENLGEKAITDTSYQVTDVVGDISKEIEKKSGISEGQSRAAVIGLYGLSQSNMLKKGRKILWDATKNASVWMRDFSSMNIHQIKAVQSSSALEPHMNAYRKLEKEIAGLVKKLDVPRLKTGGVNKESAEYIAKNYSQKLKVQKAVQEIVRKELKLKNMDKNLYKILKSKINKGLISKGQKPISETSIKTLLENKSKWNAFSVKKNLLETYPKQFKNYFKNKAYISTAAGVFKAYPHFKVGDAVSEALGLEKYPAADIATTYGIGVGSQKLTERALLPRLKKMILSKTGRGALTNILGQKIGNRFIQSLKKPKGGPVGTVASVGFGLGLALSDISKAVRQWEDPKEGYKYIKDSEDKTEDKTKSTTQSFIYKKEN
jgi:hypothetical protein